MADGKLIISQYLTLMITTLSLLLFFVSPCLSFKNVLYSALGSGTLYTNERLVYGDNFLIMQHDCNLVLYKKGPSGGIPYWATNTAPKATDCRATLSNRGELVVSGYSFGRLTRLWSSGATSKEGSYALVLKYDGTLQIYGPTIWSANAAPLEKITPSPALATDPQLMQGFDSTLWSGDVAPIGTTLDCNEFTLVLPQNCNLTLSNTRTGEILWYTDKTHFFGDCYVSLEANGELKVKYLGGDTLWRNNVASNWGEYVLALQPNGQLVVYGPSIFATNGPKAAIAMVTAEA